MATCLVVQMSTKEYPRKLLRAATYDPTVSLIRSRKRLLSEHNECRNSVVQLSNNDTSRNKRQKIECLSDDSKYNNYRHALGFSSLSCFENKGNWSSSITSYQRRKSFTYANDLSNLPSPIVLQPPMTTETVLVCQKQSTNENNNENEQKDKGSFSKLITSAELSAYITSENTLQNERLLIIDCGSPMRYNERRIKDSLLLNINDKLSKKRLISRGLKNFLDQNQLNRLNESKIIILYDDSNRLSSSSCSKSMVAREISSVMKCILNEIQRYDSNKNVHVLQSPFDEFYQDYPTFCYLSATIENNDNSSQLSPTDDIESYAMSEIISGLYLGNANDAKDKNLLKENNIKSIINISLSIPCHYENEKIIDYLQLPCHDTSQENILQYFDKTLEYIHEKLLLNQNVLVHCQGGISRSPSFIIAYLIKYHSKTFDQAYSFVKEKRKIINPNLGFLTQLTRYEQMIMSTTK